MILPLLPLDVVPVCNRKIPLVPDVPELDVETKSAPLVVEEPYPDRNSTLPPVDVLAPASILIEPPVAVFPAPTARLISPPLPSVAAPLPIHNAPLEPLRRHHHYLK